MILVSGEALIDLIPVADEDGRYDAVRGGSPYNVAIGLARLGAPTAFVSRISADANGEGLAAALAADGVDLEPRRARQTADDARLRHARHRARPARAIPSISTPPASTAPGRSRRPGRPRRAICTSARSPPSTRVTASGWSRALARAKGALTTSFDPNIRPLVTPDRAGVVALVERQVALATLVKASDEDLEWLYPGRPIEETLKLWSTLGPRFCVATLGGRGAFAYLDGERLSVAPAKVAVVDTVGAGDSFMSALLAAMDRDGALGAGAPDAEPRAPRRLARLRRRRLRYHLHPQRLRPADPRRDGGARVRLSGRIEPRA